MFNRTCPICRRAFETSRRNYYYCSLACYQRAAIKERQCGYCGKVYPGPRWKGYCSRECRAKKSIESILAEDPVQRSEGDATAGGAGVVRLPLAPEIAAVIAYHPIYAQDPSAIMESSKRILDLGQFAKILLDSPEWTKRYFELLDQLRYSWGPEHSGKKNGLQEDFQVDAGAALRTLSMKLGDRPLEEHDVRRSKQFQNGMDLIGSLAQAIPDHGFRRCVSCHIVGDEHLHFRKTRLHETWVFEELCIYCDPRVWYKDLRHR